VTPETRYARLGNDRIAYQVVGDGPNDLLFVPGMSGHVDLRWEEPYQASFLRELARFNRLIIFDRRGSGASDPFPYEPASAWEAWADDVRAVLDAAGSERATIMAQVDAGPMAILFAATQPHRTRSLILANTAARFVAGMDYSAVSHDVAENLLRELEENWPPPMLAEIGYPSMAGNEPFIRWFQRNLRASASPSAYLSYARLLQQIDVRDVLSTVRVPTLVIHREHAQLVSLGLGWYLAENIPGARLVTVPGRDLGLWTEEAETIIRHVEEFVTGADREVAVDRVLATVLHADVIGASDLASRLGQRRWRQVADRHDDLIHGHVARFQGKVLRAGADGVLATFDGPGRSINCAIGLTEALSGRGVQLRTALHTGEVEVRGEDVSGSGIAIAARVKEQAAPGEIVVTRTVRDLIAGAPFAFEDRGLHRLRGIPEEWQLYALSSA
jgi:class 3 adenylate cyclase